MVSGHPEIVKDCDYISARIYFKGEPKKFVKIAQDTPSDAIDKIFCWGLRNNMLKQEHIDKWLVMLVRKGTLNIVKKILDGEANDKNF